MSGERSPAFGRNQDCLSPRRQERKEERDQNGSVLGDLGVFARNAIRFASALVLTLHARRVTRHRGYGEHGDKDCLALDGSGKLRLPMVFPRTGDTTGRNWTKEYLVPPHFYHEMGKIDGTLTRQPYGYERPDLYEYVKPMLERVEDYRKAARFLAGPKNTADVRTGAAPGPKGSGSSAKTFNIQNWAVIVAGDNVTINIDQHIEYITDLRDAVAAQPDDSPTFAKVAKRTALDIIGGAMKEVAKGQVKKAAEQIIELSKDLGPVILNTAAYAFFRSIMQGG